MGGAGKVVKREYTAEELAAIEEGAKAEGLDLAAALALLGASTNDVYLNGVAYWRNVPERVWEQRIGGYQVIKKCCENLMLAGAVAQLACSARGLSCTV